MKKFFVVYLFILLVSNLNAQQFSGKVFEYGEDGTLKPILGAMLQWKGTSIGAITDLEGGFSLTRSDLTDTLIVISYPYENDTILVPKEKMNLSIILSSIHNLDAVQVIARSEDSYISIRPILTQVIGEGGLRKAACCNLSESFESSVAVDVEYSDAVSGAKQISMLGLAGVYTQILFENIPYIRLLSNQFGLAFVPGTFMESISISKGISSVTNGFEAISGQINVDYKKPETNREKIFLNIFGSSMGKGELNFNSRFDVGKKNQCSSMFLLHTEGQFAKMDGNNDNFLDVPLNYQVNLMNRWDYHVRDLLEGRVMVGYLWEDRTGGEINFDKNGNMAVDSIYGLNIKTHKLDVMTKNGFLLKGEHESIGTILSFTFHDNRSFFGFRQYDAQQLSGYANILYSNRFGAKERSKITAGASLQIDYLKENFEDLYTNSFLDNFSRKEVVPGIFAEYSFSLTDKLVVMPGLRFDYNLGYNQLFWTPRLHIKWNVFKQSSIRLSAGKGYRTANVIIENLSLLVSNRTFNFVDNGQLKPEEAYNVGISFVQDFMMHGGKSSFSIDYYYTHFLNQMIIDLDQDVHSVYIYNLNGGYNGSGNHSFSHSAQAELKMLPIPRFEITLAYRYNYVRLTTAGKLQEKVLMSPHKAVLNLSYATKSKGWKFNTTLQYNSSMRLPDTEGNIAEYQLSDYSPDYFIWNMQISKKLKDWEIYVGGENMLNYKQKNPILAADNPFGENFDASVIYAPLTGIMGYVGVRWSIK